MKHWSKQTVLAAVMACAVPMVAASQDTRALDSLGDLVNEGRGAVAELLSSINQAERVLSDLEDELFLTGSAPGAAGSAQSQQIADQIATHPLVDTASPICKDVFAELVTPTTRANTGAIASCIDELEPRARHNAGFECSSLYWVVAPGGQLRLQGHVQGPEDFRALEAVYGPQTVSGVVERPFPACGALEALELPLTSNTRPKLRLLSNKTRVAFRESLAFEVITPDFYAYVYVVYLQADGSVVNLTPKTRLLREQYNPNSSVRFGDGREGRQTYTASAPAGSEAIIVVTSRSPIDSLDTLEIGRNGQFALATDGALLDQGSFLALLQQGMVEEHKGVGKREISAEVLHITVVP